MIKSLKLIKPRKTPNTQTFSTLYAWGKDEDGCLGLGVHDIPTTPTQVKLPSDKAGKISSIAFGTNHSALLTDSGQVYVSGSNVSNQLGLGEASEELPERINRFRRLNSLPRISQIACGEKHSLALTPQGQIYSWGLGSTFFFIRALGLPGNKSAPSPTLLPGANRYVAIAAGRKHSLGMTKEGKVYSWGNSQYGALGNIGLKLFLQNGSRTPEVVEALTKTKLQKIQAKDYVNAAVSGEGRLYMWGRNHKQQLGVPNVNIDLQSCKNIPFHVKNDVEKNELFFKSVGLSSQRCIGLNDKGEVYQWGQIHSYPTKMDLELGPIKKVGLGLKYTMALTEDGRLYYWGKKGNVFLEKSSLTPVHVADFKGVKVKDFFTADDRVAVLV